LYQKLNIKILNEIEQLILECHRIDQEGRGILEQTLADVNKKNLVSINNKYKIRQ
jgi:hypothetical protein